MVPRSVIEGLERGMIAMVLLVYTGFAMLFGML